MDKTNRDHDQQELSGKPESIWIDSSTTTDYPPLEGGLKVDTVIVGGGIAGITVAAQLKDAGRDVAVLEAGRILNGVTGHTTAKLTSLHGLIYHQLRSKFGEKKARLYGDANETAIDHVEETVSKYGIGCDFERTPAYTYVDSQEKRKKIKREVEAARSLGLPASFVESTTLPYDVEAAVRFDDQAHFHPRKYLLALAERIPGNGSYLFENTRATDVDRGTPNEVKTERGTIAADEVVIATHFPLYDHGLYFARMSPKRGYVLAARLENTAPEGLYYRPGNPYFSVRSHPTGDQSLVLIGGQNHRTGHGGDGFDRYRKLEKEAKSKFDVASIEYRWSTQDYTSVDSVPFVGKLAPQTEDIYVATGFGGWGMSNGTAAGLLLADLIRDQENEWQSVYTPTRFKPSASAKELIKHNEHAAKHFIGDRIRSPKSTPDLSNDEGRVIQKGTDAIGVYRDEHGELHSVSAICPHMRCILHWNGAERSWACPCHGSRFTYDGTVIDGPAMKDLPKRDLER